MLELYHNAMSTCSQKIRLALAEKDLEWSGRHLDLRAGDTHTPEYLAINPQGVVPTIIHDGLVVRESNVILEYLDDAFPEPPLRPKRHGDRAQMRLWTKRLDEGHHDVATVTVSMAIAFRHQYLAKGEEVCQALLRNTPDAVRRERRRDLLYNGIESAAFPPAIRMWRRLIDDMETVLKDLDWLAGDDYSLAEAAWTPYITRLEHLHLMGLLADRPRLTAWYARIKNRPSYQVAMSEWFDPAYLSLMGEQGDKTWTEVAAIAGL